MPPLGKLERSSGWEAPSKGRRTLGRERDVSPRLTRRAFLSLVGGAAAMYPIAAHSSSEQRIALVIGNSNYQSVPALENPTRDANAVAKALREAGFQKVTVANDLDRSQMLARLQEFEAEAGRADWALIYYAGHGIEASGENYLIPIDARLERVHDVRLQAISLDRVMTSLLSAKELRLVFLDACRDNPFLDNLPTLPRNRGLAAVAPPDRTLVVYAAKNGQLALDGSGENSPFAAALAEHITTPGLEIWDIIRAVTRDVMRATNFRQAPFAYGSLPRERRFFFVR